MVLFVLEIIWIQAQDARDCFEDYERALQHKMDEKTEEESRTVKRKLKNTEKLLGQLDKIIGKLYEPECLKE